MEFSMKLFIAIFLAVSFLTYGADTRNVDKENSELYLDLLKKCLLNTIYEDQNIMPGFPPEFNAENRDNGYDWPAYAHTMIGKKRMDNLHYCIKQLLINKVPGDFIETGVWRGGATIFMRGALKAYGDNERNVWVADSFEGLPVPDAKKYPADSGWDFHLYPQLAVSLEQVQANFSKYGLLDDRVIFLKGFFSRTLSTARIKKISLLRLDGDLYESTMDALINLYPKVSIGGYIIIDDYCVPPCKAAVEDYRSSFKIKDPIQEIDGMGVFWKKTK